MRNNVIIDLLKFYGLDWLAMSLSVLAMILIGNKIKWGFVLFALANVTWILLGSLVLESYAIVIGNVLFLITNSRGFIKWNRATAKV
ncbi:MAG: PnuC protein [Pyrinomonadaceae bacterium]|nr:PnuC protein [Pyrinomonadaceae bacterium]